MRKVTLVSLAVLVCLYALVSGCTTGSTRPTAQVEQKPIRFAIISDRTGGHQPGIYEQVVAEVARMKPDFVMTVGDMIEGYSEDTSRVKAEWDEYLSLLEPLAMPIHFTPGNHDIWDSTSQVLYERYLGDPYYSFTVEGVHFVVLDASRWDTVGGFPGTQIDWLIRDLKENKDASHSLVFFHKPFWIETAAQEKPDTLHSIFTEYGVDAVFNAHYHDYFAGEFDGVKYTTLGSSGGQSSPGPTGLMYHFAWVTVDKEGVSIAPIKTEAVLPWDELSAAEYLLTRQARYQSIGTTRAEVTDDLKVPETVLTASIENLNKDIVVDDTLRWEVPEGWSLTPMLIPVRIEPEEVHSAELTVECAGPLYPSPTASMQYTYGLNKKFKVDHQLVLSRTTYAHKTGAPPVIDGRLDDPAWKEPVTEFFAPDGSSSARTDPVSFFFAWDSENLYLAARCNEGEVHSIAASATEHDGAVYGEDCVGYFFQPNTDDGPIYQIYFNPLGIAFDQRFPVKDKTPIAVEREWNGTYETATSRDGDSWSIEVRIPVSQFEVEMQPGNSWGTNFRRKQKRLNTTADWLVPIGYDPETYGALILK